MSGAAKVSKSDLIRLARALRGAELDDEDELEGETVARIYERCLERATELGQPVGLWHVKAHPAVAEWARLVLDDARRYERKTANALDAWLAESRDRVHGHRWRWIEVHLQRAAEIESEDVTAEGPRCEEFGQ